MKIELRNKTTLNSDDLRTIVKLACKQAGVAAPQLILEVVHSRYGVSGRATVPRSRSALLRGYMKLRIPKPESYAAAHDQQHPLVPLVIEVARVALHEAMHLAGVRHRDMTEEQFLARMPVPWASALGLRMGEPWSVADLQRDSAALRSDRLTHAQQMLAKAVTRRKRATTIEKKWATRVKRLSR